MPTRYATPHFLSPALNRGRALHQWAIQPDQLSPIPLDGSAVTAQDSVGIDLTTSQIVSGS